MATSSHCDERHIIVSVRFLMSNWFNYKSIFQKYNYLWFLDPNLHEALLSLWSIFSRTVIRLCSLYDKSQSKHAESNWLSTAYLWLEVFYVMVCFLVGRLFRLDIGQYFGLWNTIRPLWFFKNHSNIISRQNYLFSFW